ncbi:QueT transporter family protein [Candidatus Bathyarchaeota archaeon]|nr:QueT transporter family protein [Candidatus Bathyarchaeota archaeon]
MVNVSSRELSLTIIFATLYTVAVVSLAPISFNIAQVRIADALLPLSIIFGWPSIIGLTVGAGVANMFGGLGPIDIVGGAAANFTATFLAWNIDSRGFRGGWICAVAVEVLSVTLIVGFYLSILFGVPMAVALSGILVGSLISIGFMGYLLLKAITSPPIIKALRSCGVTLYVKSE